MIKSNSKNFEKFDKKEENSVRLNYYGEKKLFKLRRKVNELFFKEYLSMRTIAKKQGVSRNFVSKWTKSEEQDFSQDNRGWKKGKRRKWTEEDEQRVKNIYHSIKEDPLGFYTGATAIEQEWRKRYPYIPPLPLRTIGQILKDLGLSNKRRRDRHKGASRYLCYPEYTIYHLLGGRVLEVDFIGKKYITARSEPLNFIGFSFKKEPRLRYFKRVSGQTADSFIEQSKAFFHQFEKPDFMKIDNCLAAIGSAFGKRNISKTVAFLLENQVIPIFAVPKKPWSQASIEGNNSVFSRKFWNKIQFNSVDEVDEKLEWFNLASQRYTGYQPPKKEQETKKEFIPKIYFIRQVKEDKEQRGVEEEGRSFIDVLNEKVYLPSSYINYFVLAEWALRKETLFVYFEKEQQPVLVKKLSFKINEKSKKKCTKIL